MQEGHQHHHPLRAELLEVLSSGLGNGLSGRFVAPIVVLDAATVGCPAHCYEVDAQQLEDIHYRPNQVAGAQDVAAKVQDYLGGLDVVLGDGEQPVPLLGMGLEPMKDVYFPVVLGVPGAVLFLLGHSCASSMAYQPTAQPSFRGSDAPRRTPDSGSR